MAKKIIIAGGGTGGHIYPAIAIANALKYADSSIEILFVGAKGKMEMEKVPKEGYEIIGLDIAGFNRSNMLKNISLPFKMVKSYMRARKIIKDFNPNVCLGVGGYASFPILQVAQKLNIPTVLQEQNSFAGRSNKILGRKAAKICVAYDKMEQFFPSEKIIKTGNPVRRVIVNSKIQQEQGLAHYKLNPYKKTLFAFGGSLGANSINNAIMSSLNRLEEQDAQLIWQTGVNFYPKAQDAAKELKHVQVFDFLYDMEMAYAAADAIISRAGALSIAELCIAGKPVVFVPYPHAAEDHQTHNAMALVNDHAARMVPDSQAQDNLLDVAFDLLKDPEEYAENIKQKAVLDADQIIAQEILKLC